VEVIRSSKIALNIHKEYEKNGGNYRLFEIPACETFQLVDEKEKIGSYFENGKEIVTFKNEKELKAKVQYYLDHEKLREKIAQAGYDRVKKDHTLTQRMKKLLEIANECIH